jgi:hypothetical protein
MHKNKVRYSGCKFMSLDINNNNNYNFLLFYIYSCEKFRKAPLDLNTTAFYFVIPSHFLTFCKHKNKLERYRVVFILPTLWFEPGIVQSIASRCTVWTFAAAAYTNTHIFFATVNTVTKTTAVKYVLYFYTPWRYKREWSYCSTQSQSRH